MRLKARASYHLIAQLKLTGSLFGIEEEFGDSAALKLLMQGLDDLSEVEKVEIVLRDILAPLIKSSDGPKTFTDLVSELVRHHASIDK